MLAQGPEVAAFEREFAEQLVDGRHCVAVNSGTSGLHLGAARRRRRPGRRGHRPVVHLRRDRQLGRAHRRDAGVRRHRARLRSASTRPPSRPRSPTGPSAIMPVHLYGHPAAWTALQAIADKHGLQVFEDAAQAHGATLDGRPVGTFGTFAMFSLYPTKNMTSGEGGMVVVRRRRASRAWCGCCATRAWRSRYENEVVGFNTRMTDVHAAIGRVQLRQARRLDQAAPGERGVPSTRTCAASSSRRSPPGAKHVYHQYTIRVRQDRDGFAAALRERVRRRHAASTTRSRTTGCRRSSAARSTCRRPSAPPRGAVAAGAPVAVAGRPRAHRRRRQRRSRRRAPDGDAARRAASAWA